MPDFDLLVIGGGPAGYSAALRAVELGARTALVEAHAPGGACLHYNCVPSNILLDTVRTSLEARALGFLGVLSPAPEPHWGRALARRAALVKVLEEGIGNLLANQRVELVRGRASLTSPTRAAVQLADGGTADIGARAVVAATGSRTEAPAIPGLPPEASLTSDQALALADPPASLLVLGGGPAGLAFTLEYAYLFAAFGSQVTLVEEVPQLLPGEDPDLALYLAQSLTAAGVRLLTGAKVSRVSTGEGRLAQVETAEGPMLVQADFVLAPDRRRPYFEGLGLGGLRLDLSSGAMPVDERCATPLAGLYAAGDVTGRLMLTHAALHQGRVAAESALGLDSRVDLRHVPRCMHTQPEYAAVGFTEAQAREAGRAVRVGMADLAQNVRAVALGQREGAVKVVADARTGEVLGVHILGPEAPELIGQAVLAMRLEATVYDLAAAVHWHPSLSEALTEAARRASS